MLKSSFVTQADIAKAVGVSQSLVSDVIHDRNRVRIRPILRRKILAVAKEMGYQPNVAAQALRCCRSMQIAYINLHTNQRESPLFRDAALGGVAAEVRSRGYRLLVDAMQPEGAGAQMIETMIGARACDGAIVRAYQAGDLYWDQLRSLRRSVVVIGQCPAPEMVSIAHDAQSLIRGALESLRRLGHDRIALILPPARDMFSGLLRSVWLDAAGGNAHEMLVQQSNRAGVIDVVTSWISMRNGATAFIATDSASLSWALTGARGKGARLSIDVDMHGFVDVSLAPMVEPGVWLSLLDGTACGSQAAAALFEMLDGGDGPGPIRLPSPIILSDMI